MKKLYYPFEIRRAIKSLKYWRDEDYPSYAIIAVPMNIIVRRDLPVLDEHVERATKLRDRAWSICEVAGESYLTKDSLVRRQAIALIDAAIEFNKELNNGSSNVHK
jgi:hypothetical protein